MTTMKREWTNEKHENDKNVRVARFSSSSATTFVVTRLSPPLQPKFKRKPSSTNNTRTSSATAVGIFSLSLVVAICVSTATAAGDVVGGASTSPKIAVKTKLKAQYAAAAALPSSAAFVARFTNAFAGASSVQSSGAQIRLIQSAPNVFDGRIKSPFWHHMNANPQASTFRHANEVDEATKTDGDVFGSKEMRRLARRRFEKLTGARPDGVATLPHRLLTAAKESNTKDAVRKTVAETFTGSNRRVKAAVAAATLVSRQITLSAAKSPNKQIIDYSKF